MPQRQELLNRIVQELKTLPIAKDRLQEHETIKNQLAKLGSELGFESSPEYNVPEGRIDLCWLLDAKVQVAFEIDYRTPKAKSLRKLSSTPGFGCLITRQGEVAEWSESNEKLAFINIPSLVPLITPELTRSQPLSVSASLGDLPAAAPVSEAPVPKRQRTKKLAPNGMVNASALLGMFSAEEMAEVRARFPGLDLEWEAGKCVDYWNARGGAVYWKKAYRNWLDHTGNKPVGNGRGPPRRVDQIADLQTWTDIAEGKIPW